MSKPMTRAERRAYNQRRHAEQRQARAAERGPQGMADLWWERARKIARNRVEAGDEQVWADLALTLNNFCDRYSA
ncbi:hypothetical protein [Nonomuraea typhae]|uniref:Uncharacterized protein n=1 Tax=Nonomuraea typhae TaxID=2603600 RepID=A0ABW7YS32_9ACTN